MEINNTNLPGLAKSLWYRKAEINAWRYNVSKVRRLLRDANLRTVYSGHLHCGYLSRKGSLAGFLRRIGSEPYNITIAAAC